MKTFVFVHIGLLIIIFTYTINFYHPGKIQFKLQQFKRASASYRGA